MARRAAFRDRRPKLLIVCEGENTEKQYFEQFSKLHRNSLVKVEISNEHDKGLAAVRITRKLKAKAIEEAKRQGDANLKFDQVWCVFDVDEHPYVAEALSMAKSHGIRIALSNPCFELWLLLHLSDAPGMIHRHDAKKMLRNFIAGYDKNVDLQDYQKGYEKAVERARKLDELAGVVGEPGKNPTTSVYKLTEMIAPLKIEHKPHSKASNRLGRHN